MVFGLLAIICWVFLLCVILALPITVIRRNRLGTAISGVSESRIDTCGHPGWASLPEMSTSSRKAIAAARVDLDENVPTADRAGPSLLSRIQAER